MPRPGKKVQPESEPGYAEHDRNGHMEKKKDESTV
jgi:hypothetical protein